MPSSPEELPTSQLTAMKVHRQHLIRCRYCPAADSYCRCSSVGQVLGCCWCQHMTPYPSLCLQGLSVEHKLKLLQREHPSVPRQNLLQALEASGSDLSAATALLLSGADFPTAARDAEQVSFAWAQHHKMRQPILCQGLRLGPACLCCSAGLQQPEASGSDLSAATALPLSGADSPTATWDAEQVRLSLQAAGRMLSELSLARSASYLAAPSAGPL